jgi:L-fuculose-phosphate aldolase
MSWTERGRLVDALCAAGRRLDACGLVPARDGNLSARWGDRVLVTRSGVHKRELTAADVVEAGLDGIAMGSGKPSTELGLHLAVYRRRPDARAVVHAHPPVAVGFACAGRGLEAPLLSEAAMTLGPVPCLAYATPGSPALEERVGEAVGTGVQAVLLANHGAVTLGGSVEEAVDRMETLEHAARAALVAHLLGGGIPIPPDEAARLLAQSLRKP